MLVEGGYKVRVLNLIDFSQSMKYNPFRYLHSENDILKLVNCIMENTKGEGTSGGEDFWQKAEALYYQALIAYIWYEARPEEKNMNTLLAMLNASEVPGKRMKHLRMRWTSSFENWSKRTQNTLQ